MTSKAMHPPIQQPLHWPWVLQTSYKTCLWWLRSKLHQQESPCHPANIVSSKIDTSEGKRYGRQHGSGGVGGKVEKEWKEGFMGRGGWKKGHIRPKREQNKQRRHLLYPIHHPQHSIVTRSCSNMHQQFIWCRSKQYHRVGWEKNTLLHLGDLYCSKAAPDAVAARQVPLCQDCLRLGC